MSLTVEEIEARKEFHEWADNQQKKLKSYDIRMKDIANGITGQEKVVVSNDEIELPEPVCENPILPEDLI